MFRTLADTFDGEGEGKQNILFKIAKKQYLGHLMVLEWGGSECFISECLFGTSKINKTERSTDAVFLCPGAFSIF